MALEPEMKKQKTLIYGIIRWRLPDLPWREKI